MRLVVWEVRSWRKSNRKVVVDLLSRSFKSFVMNHYSQWGQGFRLSCKNPRMPISSTRNRKIWRNLPNMCQLKIGRLDQVLSKRLELQTCQWLIKSRRNLRDLLIKTMVVNQILISKLVDIVYPNLLKVHLAGVFLKEDGNLQWTVPVISMVVKEEVTSWTDQPVKVQEVFLTCQNRGAESLMALEEVEVSFKSRTRMTSCRRINLPTREFMP